jgi:hypothetical protein
MEWNRTCKVSKNQSTDRYRIRSKTFIEGSNEYDKKGGDGDQLNMVNSMLSFLKKSTNEFYV